MTAIQRVAEAVQLFEDAIARARTVNESIQVKERIRVCLDWLNATHDQAVDVIDRRSEAKN